ncbi:LysR family transcriptional regulator [Pseudomonas syringae]|uniref:LysR family transcriptional regulator n=1 Tax=Pseudomonas syringae TaxID=317 RepID=UPI00200B7D73|nr:LysR family transcriptional regulator [Pseudomonas syringae]MCK9720822.1 LysR family transcriptional regulator [Pseudomonas syringae pv. syringae]
MFELSQLRCFTTVATELNFRRAAERLNMTQPPLSRQIQILEHNLGVELFTRSTRSVALTAAGRAFFIEAQTLLERAQQAAISARRFAEGDIGSVTISFVGSAVRRIDLGIVRAPLFQPGYESECLVREPFVLAVPSNHRLAHADSVAVADLDGAPFLMYSHSAYPPFNELLTGMFRSARVAPEYVQWLGSSLTILALVNAGMGLALVPRCATNVVFKDVVFRDIDLGEGVQSELHLVWRTDNDNPACRMLLEAIRAAVRADEN